jgi:hypothetical protein
VSERVWSRPGGSAPGEILANGGHVGTRFSALQGCQTLGDASNSVAVAKDLQGHFQTFEIIYRKQDSFGVPVASQGDPTCCWRTRLASSDRRAFASDSGTGVAAMPMDRIMSPTSLYLDQPGRRA